MGLEDAGIASGHPWRPAPPVTAPRPPDGLQWPHRVPARRFAGTVPLGGQFLLHPLESLFDNPLLAVRTLNRLIPGEPLMGQFGLEVVDRRLGLLEQMLCMLSCRDLLPQSLPCCFERIGAGCVTLIPVDDRDRNLAIPDEAPTLWM